MRSYLEQRDIVVMWDVQVVQRVRYHCLDLYSLAVVGVRVAPGDAQLDRPVVDVSHRVAVHRKER